MIRSLYFLVRCRRSGVPSYKGLHVKKGDVRCLARY